MRANILGAKTIVGGADVISNGLIHTCELAPLTEYSILARGC
jgi:hypothetical protein